MRIPDEAVQAALKSREHDLADRPDPMVLSDERLTRRMLEAAWPFLLAQMTAEKARPSGPIVSAVMGETKELPSAPFPEGPDPAEELAWLRRQVAEYSDRFEKLETASACLETATGAMRAGMAGWRPATVTKAGRHMSDAEVYRLADEAEYVDDVDG